MIDHPSPKTLLQVDEANSNAEAPVSATDSGVEAGALDKKKLKRVMANRRSAKASKERRVKLFSELQSSIDDLLLPTNRVLKEENRRLRNQLQEIKQQFHLLQRPHQGTTTMMLPPAASSSTTTARMMATMQQESERNDRFTPSHLATSGNLSALLAAQQQQLLHDPQQQALPLHNSKIHQEMFQLHQQSAGNSSSAGLAPMEAAEQFMYGGAGNSLAIGVDQDNQQSLLASVLANQAGRGQFPFQY